MFSANLTPELSRTAARHGGVVNATTWAEPRSGLGLNELLGAPSVRFFLKRNHNLVAIVRFVDVPEDVLNLLDNESLTSRFWWICPLISCSRLEVVAD